MKRRNVDAGKPPRRPSAKRGNKFTDSIYGSWCIYIKFVVIWLLILLADFILEFRFEYIWPFWLFVQSVYETFKYQGLAYSIVFVVIAITSDTICMLFIPIQYLFFMASTYVWIHYVWHTEKGVCLPTIAMWFVIMYIEVTMRIRDLKSNQFNIDLCRPFAAHCIGHPVVTLGIGFKSYLLYRFKLRTQRLVRKENSFYYELLRQALPREVHTNHTLAVTDKEKDITSQANGVLSNQSAPNKKYHEKSQKPLPVQDSTLQIAETSSVSAASKHTPSGSTSSSGQKKQGNQMSNNLQTLSSKNNSDNSPVTSSNNWFLAETNNLRIRNVTSTKSKKSTAPPSESTSSPAQANKSSSKTTSDDHSPKTNRQHTTRSLSTSDSDKQKTSLISNSAPLNAPEFPVITPPVLTNGHVVSEKTVEPETELSPSPSVIERLEATISKLKAEINAVRKNESDLKSRIEVLMMMERTAKSDAQHLRKDNDTLHTKLNTMAMTKQKDKANMQTMEKRLKTEVDNRESAEKLLLESKRQRKEDEEIASRAAALAQSNRDKESADVLKKAKKDLEAEIEKLKKKLDQKEEECNRVKKDLQELQASEKSAKESETLMSALEAMQEKNIVLEKSLSAETRLKLDLFSALGDVKRQLELAHALIFKREAECGDLKARMADFLSVMPENRLVSAPHYSANFLEPKPMVTLNPGQECQTTFCPLPRTPAPSMIQPHPRMEHNMINPHHPTQAVYLDPNAAMYSPNTSGI